MREKRQIAQVKEGWKHLTDMLRSSYTCATADEVIETIEKISASQRVVLLRIEHRFWLGDPGNPNDVIVNYEY